MKCSHCKDTGLYDAGCRPHVCDCDAGQRYYDMNLAPLWMRQTPEFKGRMAKYALEDATRNARRVGKTSLASSPETRVKIEEIARAWEGR